MTIGIAPIVDHHQGQWRLHWATSLPKGRVVDAEYRVVGTGDFVPLVTGTTARGAAVDLPHGVSEEFRVRVRRPATGAASDWSPVVSAPG